MAICAKMIHSDHSRSYSDQKFWISVLKATIFGRTPRSLPQIPHFYTATCGRLVSCDKLATFILYNTSTSTPTCILRLVLVLVPQVTLIYFVRSSLLCKLPANINEADRSNRVQKDSFKFLLCLLRRSRSESAQQR